MHIDTDRFRIKKFNIYGMDVYIDQKEGTINGDKPEFGNAKQAKIVRAIEENELEGRDYPDFPRIYSEYLGKTFGGKDLRSKRMKLLEVGRINFLVNEKGIERLISPRKFNSWAKRSNIFIVSNNHPQPNERTNTDSRKERD